MKVSVALCTYNGERFLTEQLESILQQTRPINEIVICDDQSSDASLPIINQFQAKYPSIIKTYVNESNLGGKKNFEKALSLCTGDIIFFSDQDDVWLPDKVAIIVKLLTSDSSLWGVASDAFLVDKYNRPIGNSFWESMNFDLDSLESSTKIRLCEYILTYGNVVAGAMMAIKREALPFVYPFKFLSDLWHDEWMVLVLSSLDRFTLIKDKLVAYRIHDKQQIGLGTEKRESWLAYKALQKDTERFKTFPADYLSHAWSIYLKFNLYKKEITALNDLQKVFDVRLQEAKINFLKKQNFFMRKARLVKWFINNEFNTSFRDVLIL